MNVLVIVLFVLVGVIACLLVAALFIRREYAIKRDIIIKRQVPDVFDYVKKLKNQDNFSKWVMADPNKKKTFRGIDGTVGFVYAWNGDKQAGEGEQEITGIKENERVDIEVRFVRPFKSVAKTPFVTERVDNDQTKVTWGMEGRSAYPLNLMYAMMSGVFGKDLEISLQSLKDILEKESLSEKN